MLWKRTRILARSRRRRASLKRGVAWGMKMQVEKDETAVPEAPQISSDTWFALAIAAFLIALIIFTGVASWIFTGDPEQIQPRAQAFTPFGGALIAVVTFFTIAWRGVLNTRQLEYQAAQIKHQVEQLTQTKRQNDAKDEENLAKLLMDGTKLSGDDKESHVLAGVAVLQAVATSPRGAFASQAMDILVDLVEGTYNQIAKVKIYDAAREAVNLGATAGRKSTRRISLLYDDDKTNFTHAINGVQSVFYRNAYFDYSEYPRFTDIREVRFEKCLIEEATIHGNHLRFTNCEFHGCKISTMTGAFLEKNSFESCDFSGAKYTGSRPKKPQVLERLRNHGNFFSEDNPIIGGVPSDWVVYLDMIATIEFEDLEEGN
ncbi:hypothetical protein AB9F42_33655 [Rhizobium leguminosarum]|uniref:hypothetical protein n=1 Tax=Rhizobium leguminosarum TaxID=384 RepID=UPI003F98709C